MRSSPECLECLLSRVRFESLLVTDDFVLVNEIIEDCKEIIGRRHGDPVASTQIASEVHRCAMARLNSDDPYIELKNQNNADGLKVSESVRGTLSTFHDLCLASVIGNTLDYGSSQHEVTNDFMGFFKSQYERGFKVDHTEKMAELTDRVVYFTDNCGEIAFDSLLIRYLKEHGSHVTVAVKDVPILNDATMDDIRYFGIDDIADCVVSTSNGIPELGWNPELSPVELNRAIDKGTIIISKGMANYESFTEYHDLPPVAFLMAVKCDPISRHVGISKGSNIALLRE